MTKKGREIDKIDTLGGFERRKHKKVDSPYAGKGKGMRAWIRTRHRVRRKLLGR